MAYKINEDLYIGNTNKQLKDLLVPVHDAYSTSTTDTYSCNYINHVVETGGSSNYNNLSNKPSINGVILEGNKTSEDLGINGQVLYDNSTGTNGTVTLSDSAANYDYLEIYFRTNDSIDYKNSVKIYSPDNALVPLSYPLVAANGTAIYWKTKTVRVSGNSIFSSDGSRYAEATIKATTSISQKNYVYITKVIGYHDTPKQVDTIPMSDMYYKPGDVYTITDRAYITVGGSLTASKGQVRFGVFLPKLLTNINSVTVSLAKLTIRNTSGSYIIDYKDVTSALSASKSGDNTVYLSYGAKSMSGTNNTPVSVEINALKLTFN